MPFFQAAPRWSPHTNLPGLLFCADWTRSKFQDAARATAATAVSDVVYWWGGLKAIAADATRPLLAAGPVSANLSQVWDGTNAKAVSVAGSFMAGTSMTMGIVFKMPTQSAQSQLIGRGGASGNGFRMYTSASGELVGEVNCATTGVVSLTDPGEVDDSAWQVVVLTTNGTTARLYRRGSTAQSSAAVGALTYHANDTAFAVGGATTNGTDSYFQEAKTVALALVTADTFNSAALVTQLANNLAAYAGVP